MRRKTIAILTAVGAGIIAIRYIDPPNKGVVLSGYQCFDKDCVNLILGLDQQTLEKAVLQHGMFSVDADNARAKLIADKSSAAQAPDYLRP